MGNQFSVLVEAMATCTINRDVELGDFKAFIMNIPGQTSILFVDYMRHAVPTWICTNRN